jgi:hypothetical protein
MGGVESMTDIEIMEQQSILIESQRQLFINTVDQFKRDLIFMQGMFSILHIEVMENNDISDKALTYILSYLSEMQSMLNDFDLRMADCERD